MDVWLCGRLDRGLIGEWRARGRMGHLLEGRRRSLGGGAGAVVGWEGAMAGATWRYEAAMCGSVTILSGEEVGR